MTKQQIKASIFALADLLYSSYNTNRLIAEYSTKHEDKDMSQKALAKAQAYESAYWWVDNLAQAVKEENEQPNKIKKSLDSAMNEIDNLYNRYSSDIQYLKGYSNKDYDIGYCYGAVNAYGKAFEILKELEKEIENDN